MKTCLFDLETYGLNAPTGLVLCGVGKEFLHGDPWVVRADELPGWKDDRSYGNCRATCKAILDELHDYDIFIAHNGYKFDRALLISFGIRFKLPLFMRFSKFYDPVLAARKHMRLVRNDLASLADFLGVKMKKTPIHWDDWRSAAFDGDRAAMDNIVEHCVADVLVLEKVHEKMRKLAKDINERGSAF